MRDQEPVYLRIGKGDSAVEFEFPVAENIQEEVKYHYDELRENPYTMAHTLAAIGNVFSFTAKANEEGHFLKRYNHQSMALEDRIKRAKELQEAAANEVARLESLSFWDAHGLKPCPNCSVLEKAGGGCNRCEGRGFIPKEA